MEDASGQTHLAYLHGNKFETMSGSLYTYTLSLEACALTIALRMTLRVWLS